MELRRSCTNQSIYNSLELSHWWRRNDTLSNLAFIVVCRQLWHGPKPILMLLYMSNQIGQPGSLWLALFGSRKTARTCHKTTSNSGGDDGASQMTVRSRYLAVIFLEIAKESPIIRPWGWGMGCTSRVQSLAEIKILPSTRWASTSLRHCMQYRVISRFIESLQHKDSVCHYLARPGSTWVSCQAALYITTPDMVGSGFIQRSHLTR